MVFPLLKKPGLPAVPSNFRPISNLSFLSKTLVCVVAHQLVSHMDKFKLHDPMQSAYRRYHSTETSLLKIHKDILCMMDDKKLVLLIMLDLSAAFDTVDHTIMIDRLSTKIGLSGTVLNWFESYLEQRKSFVYANGSSSNSVKLQWGVPQGSVLGPTHFSIYVSPVADIIRKHKLLYHIYADDIQIYASFTLVNKAEVFSAVQECVSDIKEWTQANRLKLNDNKSEAIILGRNRHLSCISDKRLYLGDTLVDCNAEFVILVLYSTMR